jgi:hypothetical protein
LAAAELQAKNMAIEAQQLIINLQKGLLDGKLVSPKPQAKDLDREEFFGGIAALSVYKKGGAEISLARIYRYLKELFKEEE